MTNIVCAIQEKIPELRINRTKKYSVVDIFLTAFIGILAGGKSWNSIVDLAENRLSVLSKLHDLPNGIPSHDTVNRFFQVVSPDVMESLIREYALSKFSSLSGTQIDIDGKRLCGSSDASDITHHMLSAWATDYGLSLGMLEVDSKTNEIPAIPQLLDKLYIKDALVSIDAMGAQVSIVDQIRKQRGHYFIALKGNQSKSQDKDSERISNYIPEDSYEIFESSRGCCIERSCRVFSINKQAMPEMKKWKDIKSIVSIESKTTKKKSKEVLEERRLYITDIGADSFSAKQFLDASKNHWTIERDCHWTLDVIFDEDSSRKYAKNSASNFSCLLHICKNGMRNLPEFAKRKGSISSFMDRLSLDHDLLGSFLHALFCEPS